MKYSPPLGIFIKKTVRLLAIAAGSLLLLSLVLSLLLMIPAVQTRVTDEVTKRLSEKTGVALQIKAVHIAFPKTVELHGILVEDAANDTIAYCHELNVNVALLPLIMKKVNIAELKIGGLVGKAYRQAGDSTFNFSPFLLAFSSDDQPLESTNTQTWDIGFDDIVLEDIELHYSDQRDSVFINAILGKLHISANHADVLAQEYDLKSIELSEFDANISLSNVTGRAKDTAHLGALPLKLGLEQLKISNTSIDFKFGTDQMRLFSTLKSATLKSKIIDIQNSHIVLDEFFIDGLNTELSLNISDNTEKLPGKPVISADSLYAFGNFDWRIAANQAAVANSRFKIDMDNDLRNKGEFDHQHLQFDSVQFEAESISFDMHAFSARILALAISEHSGLNVQHFGGQLSIDNKGFDGEEMQLQMDQSDLSGDVHLAYQSLSAFTDQLGMIETNINLKGSINLQDLRPFADVWDQYDALKGIRELHNIEVLAAGKISDLTFDKIAFDMAKSTHFSLSTHITGFPASQLKFEYALDTFYTTRADLHSILPDSGYHVGIQLPTLIGIKSTGASDLKDGHIEAYLASDFGNCQFTGNLQNGSFETDFELLNLELGSIMNDSTIGRLTLINTTEGTLNDSVVSQFVSGTEIAEIEWNDHLIRDIKLDIAYQNDLFTGSISFADSTLQASANGRYYEEDSIHNIEATFDIDYFNLHALNLMQEEFITSLAGELELHAKSATEAKGMLAVQDIQLTRPANSYTIDTLTFLADIDASGSDFFFRSDVLDASLTGNTRLSELGDALADHIDRYLDLPDSIVSDKDFIFDFGLDLKEPAFFTGFLIDGLHEFQLDTFKIHYHDANDVLQMKITMPSFAYDNIAVSDFQAFFDTTPEAAFAEFQASDLTVGVIALPKINLASKFEPHRAMINLSASDVNDSLNYNIGCKILFQDSSYQIALSPDDLIINYQPWKIAGNKTLFLGSGLQYTQNTQLTNGVQSIGLEAGNDRINVAFKDFELINLAELVLQDSSIETVNGAINGTIQLDHILKTPKFSADIIIDRLRYGSVPLGAIEAHAQYQAEMPVNFNFQLQDTSNTILVQGEIPTANRKTGLSAILALDMKEVHKFEPLFSPFFSDIRGGLNGRMAISGTPEKPLINGKFDLQALQLTIVETNTQLSTSGQVSIIDNLLVFNNLTTMDSLRNSLSINGNIDISKPSDPLFDLTVDSDDFVFLNKKLSQSDVVAGRLNLGLNVQIEGRQSRLKVVNNVSINAGTDVIYIMPGNELELITDEGIVEYVDLNNLPTETLSVDQQGFIGDSIVSLVKGIDFQTMLSIDPAAQFTIVIDQNAGDYSKFNLKGNLYYKYTDEKKGALNGLIELEQGFYELSFYGLVKKQFAFEPGSTLSWSGGVMEGTLRFAARHTVRTNSVGLVSNEISSYERALYNQRLPYEVVLRIEDQISSPMITFELDLPDRYRSTYPTLDSKLNILNQPSMESERNKQVFALLVGGTFIPEDPGITEGSGGSNFATTAARNSVNAIMTQQLNNLTGRFIRGFDLDMGVNTFDDFSSGKSQTRTQLDLKVSKNLFNDRVTAEMESHINLDGSVGDAKQSGTAGMTEFAVSYKLTEAGNYRIKGFRENAFDIFDGEIQNSGIAFIFIKEFDRFGKSDVKIKEANNSAAKEK
jgi:translocation and assembly module TamB